jgi:hyaluronoglucosaminidase
MNHSFPLGIVEGFYGEPWSFDDRMSMIDFLGQYDFNTYVYAPKDDPYHRSKWRRAYPPKLSQRIVAIIQKCNENNVRFVFTVSPGLSITYSSTSDRRLLLKKLRFAIDLGCSWVGVMLDDIDTKIAAEKDKQIFRGLADAHSYLLNSLKDQLGGVRLIFCPTYYANQYLGRDVSHNHYLETIGNDLDRSIDVMWTGRHVVSTTITEKDVRGFSKVVRRPPFLWDNYPVNDYYKDRDRRALRLNFGPFKGRSRSIIKLLSGYVSNPMEQAEASKVPLLTLSDLVRNPKYSADRSFEKAIRTRYSEDNAFREIRELIRASKASPLDPTEAEDLRELLSKVMHRDGRSRKELRKKLEFYLDLPEKLGKTSEKKFLKEVGPLLEKIMKLSRLGLYCIDSLEHSKSSSETKRKMQKAIEAVRQDPIQVLGEMRFAPENEKGYGLGLPRLSKESPVVQLYEYARTRK